MATAAKISPPERYPSGDRKPDEEAPKGKPPALVKRIMDHAIALGADRRVGTVLGLMHLEGILSEIEMEAGLRYAQDVGAYEAMKGHPNRHSQSPSFEAGRKGGDGLDLDALERMDPEAAEKVKRRIERKHRAIQKHYDRAQACIPAVPIIISTLVEEVCCNDRRIHSGHHPDLKKILRNLATQCYRLHEAPKHDDAKPKRGRPPRADAAIMANGAIEALAAWFDKRKAVVTEFSLIGASITAHGHSQHGEVLSHTIQLRDSKVMREALAAQVLKAAEARGWKEAKPTADTVEVSVEAIRAGIRRKE